MIDSLMSNENKKCISARCDTFKCKPASNVSYFVCLRKIQRDKKQ